MRDRNVSEEKSWKKVEIKNKLSEKRQKNGENTVDK